MESMVVERPITVVTVVALMVATVIKGMESSIVDTMMGKVKAKEKVKEKGKVRIKDSAVRTWTDGIDSQVKEVICLVMMIGMLLKNDGKLRILLIIGVIKDHHQL